MVPALEEILAATKSMVFFGGAGVSTESGIPDFRSVDGLYHQKFEVPARDDALPHLLRDPHRRFLTSTARSSSPTGQSPTRPTCVWRRWSARGKCRAVVTQNIDGLHQAAGSKTVYELHGSTLRNYCTRCGKFFPVQFIEDAAGVGDGVPRCDECGGIVKPDVVLYEEGLDEETMENAVHAIRGADTLIVGGTSLAVYPAAGLLRYFRGENLVVINKQPTPADAMANLLIHAPIGRTLDPDAPIEV